MRVISANLRDARDSEFTTVVEAAMVVVEHPDLPEPIRVASDNVHLFSRDPYVRGVKSLWRSPDGKPARYLHIAMAVTVPDESEAVPVNGNIVIAVLDSKVSEVLTSNPKRFKVHVATILSDAPDFIESEYQDLTVTGAEGDGGVIKLSFGNEDVLDDYHPRDRTTKERFPGLHK